MMFISDIYKTFSIMSNLWLTCLSYLNSQTMLHDCLTLGNVTMLFYLGIRINMGMGFAEEEEPKNTMYPGLQTVPAVL